MFDLAWSEIALIGVVALIAIGPKDLPIAIKALAAMLKKGRRMASEFQGHVDEMVREANLHEVRDQINEMRTMDVKGRVLNAIDGDGFLRRTINDGALDPMRPQPGVAIPLGADPLAAETPVPAAAPDAQPELPLESSPPPPLATEPAPETAPVAIQSEVAHPVAAHPEAAPAPSPARTEP